jgi:hypothetical protein
VEGDQIRPAYSVEGQLFDGEIGAGNIVSIGAQARRRRSQPKRLPAKLVSRH